MNEGVVVFLGPSLPVTLARAVLDAEYLPPVQLGDVWRIAQERPSAIGIVDGYFDRVPSVWHKEILFALGSGIPVYGSASMGALRAAELGRFGMIAVGAIAQAYRAGELTGDDEVALGHADGEHGYRAFSEPLVNIRATVRAATRQRILAPESTDVVVRTARSLFYPDRTWEAVLDAAPLPPDQRVALDQWLPEGRVDQKRADALAMLERMRDDLGCRDDLASAAPDVFVPTVLWRELVRRETPIEGILEEFLLCDPLARVVRDGVALARGGAPVDWLAVLPSEPDWPRLCRRARRKAARCGPPGALTADVAAGATGSAADDEDRLLAWFFGERLGWPTDLDGFLLERGWADARSVLTVAVREAAFVAS
jgi:hypothetical protein